PEFLMAYIAISAFGGVMQTMHMPYGRSEIELLLEHSHARAVICLPSFKETLTADIMVELRSSLEFLEHVIILGDKVTEKTINLESLISRESVAVGNPPVGSDPVLLLYTSGTTSNPKGVPLTNQNMLDHAKMCVPEFGMTDKDRILSVAPFSHLYGLYNYHCSLFAGAAAVLLPAFSPNDLIDLVEKKRPTAIFMGPAHAAAYRSSELLDNADFSSVNYTVFSGAYSPPDDLKWWNEKTGSKICQLWGMTELAAGTFTRPNMDLDIAIKSAGPAAPGNEVRVVSPDERTLQLPDVEGELEVRGSSVFPGYLFNAEANKDAFDSDGWFKTGDLAKIDESGNLTVTGRIKDIINRGGIKYNPADVEEVIIAHKNIETAAIVPMPDSVLGEKACCFIKLLKGKNMGLDELTDYLEKNGISKNRWPEKLVMLEQMPLTPTRKVIKGKLLKLLPREN
ncbi:MAG: class I adenylate-forming enzyme family protein, partial [Pseudomonadota bacterium]|nr:class I adenylate-forming enzyme family protein [Pseudomonadota bacterium]